MFLDNVSRFSLGMCCVVAPSYLNEISPRALRGIVGSCHQLAIVIGILVGQIVALPWILGRHRFDDNLLSIDRKMTFFSVLGIGVWHGLVYFH